MTLSLTDFDALIGFGKPASKTADWIVDTYLSNAPVSYRLSIEHAIAQAIVDSRHFSGVAAAWEPPERLRGMTFTAVQGDAAERLNPGSKLHLNSHNAWLASGKCRSMLEAKKDAEALNALLASASPNSDLSAGKE